MRKHLLSGLLVSLIATPAVGDFTLETGDRPGELFFLWQGILTTAGAQSHRLSEMPAFQYAFDGNTIEEIEILEVRQMDTDQLLPFSYVLPKGLPAENKLLDVAWYYPNPIPSGGRAKVQIRGRMTASSVYKLNQKRIEIAYRSGEGIFVVLPLGYALTYCNAPVIVYEKNSRTVCTFQLGNISLQARSAEDMLKAKEPPTIDRTPRVKVIQSRLPLLVEPCESSKVSESANKTFAAGLPVLFKSIEKGALQEGDPNQLIPGETLIWKIDDALVNGPEGFQRMASKSVIGSVVKLYLATINDKRDIVFAKTVMVRVLAEEKPTTSTQPVRGKD